MGSVGDDMKWGAVVEQQWAAWLKCKNPRFEITYAPKRKFPGWDLMTKVPAGRCRYYEVKWDASAQAPWRGHRGDVLPATGNIYVEYRNPRQDKPSGISTSQAHYWVYCMLQAYQLVDMEDVELYRVQAFVLDKDKFLSFCKSANLKSVDTIRDTGGGKVNAQGWLVPIADIMNDRKSSGLKMKVDFTDYIRTLFL